MNTKENDFKELEELIVLSEKVSEKTEYYKNRSLTAYLKLVISITATFGLSFFCVYMSSIYYFDINSLTKNILIAMPIITAIVGVVYATVCFMQYRKNRALFMYEKDMLVKLLEIADEFKNIIFSKYETSIIEKTLIDMRLRRISFNK